MTVVDVLQEAARRGLSLSVNGQKLRVSPAKLLTPDFVETLKAHKWHLLSMLRRPFLIVHSLTLGTRSSSARMKTPQRRSKRLALPPGTFTPAMNCGFSWRKTA